MSNRNMVPVTLDTGDLNDMDVQLLDLLRDGRATPTLLRKFLEEGGTEVSRQYINQRLKRLAEHEHIENLLETGVYQLVDDPFVDGIIYFDMSDIDTRKRHPDDPEYGRRTVPVSIGGYSSINGEEKPVRLSVVNYPDKNRFSDPERDSILGGKESPTLSTGSARYNLEGSLFEFEQSLIRDRAPWRIHKITTSWGVSDEQGR